MPDHNPIHDHIAYHDALLYVYRKTPPPQRYGVLVGLAANTQFILTAEIEKEHLPTINACENFSEAMLGKIMGGWLYFKIKGEVEAEDAFAKGRLEEWVQANNESIQLEQACWKTYDGINHVLEGRAAVLKTGRQLSGVILGDDELDAIASTLRPGVSYESLRMVCEAVCAQKTNSPEVVERFLEKAGAVVRKGGVAGDRRGTKWPFILNPLHGYGVAADTPRYAPGIPVPKLEPSIYAPQPMSAYAMSF